LNHKVPVHFLHEHHLETDLHQSALGLIEEMPDGRDAILDAPMAVLPFVLEEGLPLLRVAEADAARLRESLPVILGRLVLLTPTNAKNTSSQLASYSL